MKILKEMKDKVQKIFCKKTKNKREKNKIENQSRKSNIK